MAAYGPHVLNLRPQWPQHTDNHQHPLRPPHPALRPASPINTVATPAPNVPRRNAALELAIQRHTDDLPANARQAFDAAAKDFSEDALLAKVREHDEQHVRDSGFRSKAERVFKVLRLLDRFMGGVTIAILSP